MLTGKQRATLRAMANDKPAWFQIGKGGVNENFLSDVSNALEAHELVKITVLKTAGEQPKVLIKQLSQALGAEEVAAVGYKIVLYRRSSRDDVAHIEL